MSNQKRRLEARGERRQTKTEFTTVVPFSETINKVTGQPRKVTITDAEGKTTEQVDRKPYLRRIPAASLRK